MNNELPDAANGTAVRQAPEPDKFLLYLREITTIVIAAAVILGFATMLWLTYGAVSAPPNEPTYQRVKDLLLITEPFLGIVIGYYFSKVSTEPRAENAEANARAATENAENAQAGESEAKKESEESKLALANLAAAADAVMGDVSATGMGITEGGVDKTGALGRLRLANERAKSIVG